MIYLFILIAFLGLGIIFFAFFYLVNSRSAKNGQISKDLLTEKVPKEAANNAFNEEFREELRNKGRLEFEKTLTENTGFLREDLQLTATELTKFMKQEITIKLQEEFKKYEQSIDDAKNIAVAALQKTNDSIEEHRDSMNQQIQTEIDNEKQRVIDNFEKNITKIVNHYIINAIGNQIDLDDQLEYILADLEANKQAILEDIKNGG